MIEILYLPLLELLLKPVSETHFPTNASVAYESTVLIPKLLFELWTQCVCGLSGTAEGGIRFWLCLCGTKSLTELADLRADGEKWVHPQDKHIQTLSLTRTNRNVQTHTCIFSKSVSLSLSFPFKHTEAHTVWLNNGPVSGVPMGKAVSLIESSILHSPCLLIDSVRLFCSTKRLTFSPVRLWLSQCEWLYVCVCVIAYYLLRAAGSCVCVCGCVLSISLI